MPIKIHNNDYVTVAERVKAIHEKEKNFEIVTKILSNNPVVVKAVVKTEKGIFTGISSANPMKAIEKTNPYEVAETSAVGRALGFAGYGVIDSIATAEEIIYSEKKQAEKTKQASSNYPSSEKQRGLIYLLYKEKNGQEMPEEEKAEIRKLNSKQASELISKWKEASEPKENFIEGLEEDKEELLSAETVAATWDE